VRLSTPDSSLFDASYEGAGAVLFARAPTPIGEVDTSGLMTPAPSLASGLVAPMPSYEPPRGVSAADAQSPSEPLAAAEPAPLYFASPEFAAVQAPVEGGGVTGHDGDWVLVGGEYFGTRCIPAVSYEGVPLVALRLAVGMDQRVIASLTPRDSAVNLAPVAAPSTPAAPVVARAVAAPAVVAATSRKLAAPALTTIAPAEAISARTTGVPVSPGPSAEAVPAPQEVGAAAGQALAAIARGGKELLAPVFSADEPTQV